MPKGPKGEKRPADVIGAAVKVMRIATGEEAEDIDTPASRGVNPHASAMGKLGAAARAKKVGAKKRKEIARKAAATRWKKVEK